MPDSAPPVKAPDAGTPKADDHDREVGKKPDGAHLERRQTRNTNLTEEAQQNPTGGAHSGSPDPTNP